MRNIAAQFVLVATMANPQLATAHSNHVAQLNKDGRFSVASHAPFNKATISIADAVLDASTKTMPIFATTPKPTKTQVPPQTNVPSESKTPTNVQAGTRTPAETTDPAVNLPAPQKAFVLDAEEQMLPWHEWHHRICKALGKQVKKASGKMLGTVNLRITIGKDQKLAIELVNCTNDILGQVCVEATKGLDLDPVFAFPQGSKRETMAIDFQIKRNLYGLPFDQYVKDDFEKLNQD